MLEEGAKVHWFVLLVSKYRDRFFLVFSLRSAKLWETAVISCTPPTVLLSRDGASTGAAGSFAPIDFKHWEYSPVLKRVAEFLNVTKVRKSQIESAKLEKLMLIIHFL